VSFAENCPFAEASSFCQCEGGCKKTAEFGVAPQSKVTELGVLECSGVQRPRYGT